MSAGLLSHLACGWSLLVALGELYLTSDLFYFIFFFYALNRFPSLVCGGEHTARGWQLAIAGPALLCAVHDEVCRDFGTSPKVPKALSVHMGGQAHP